MSFIFIHIFNVLELLGKKSKGILNFDQCPMAAYIVVMCLFQMIKTQRLEILVSYSVDTCILCSEAQTIQALYSPIHFVLKHVC